MSEWISLREKNPEIGQYVICIAKRNPFSPYVPMVAKILRNGWVNMATDQYVGEIKCWMPMPEPPKEE